MPTNSLSVSGKLVAGFIAILLGVILIGTIASEALDKTDKDLTTNEIHVVASTYAAGRNISTINPTIVYTATNAPTGWKSNDCPLTNFALTNSSGNVLAGSGYVLNTATGTWTLTNTGTKAFLDDHNTTYATYNYCPDNYMNLGWGRTLLLLVSGFFAIAIVLVGVGLFYSIAKDTGII